MYKIAQTSTMPKHNDMQAVSAEHSAQQQVKTAGAPDLEIESRLRHLRGLEPLANAACADNQLESLLQKLPEVQDELPLNELQRMSLISPVHKEIARLSVADKSQDMMLPQEKEKFSKIPNGAATETQAMNKVTASFSKASGVTAMLVSKDFYLAAADFVQEASHRTDYCLAGDKDSASAFINEHNHHLKTLRTLIADSKADPLVSITLAKFARIYLKGMNFECTPQATDEDYRKLMYKTYDMIQGHMLKEHQKISHGLAATTDGVDSYKSLTQDVLRTLEKEKTLLAEKQYVAKRDKEIDNASDDEVIKKFLNNYESKVVNFYNEVADMNKKNEKKLSSPFVFLGLKKSDKYEKREVKYDRALETCLDLRLQIHAVRSVAEQHNYKLQLSLDSNPPQPNESLQMKRQMNPYLMRHQQLTMQQSLQAEQARQVSASQPMPSAPQPVPSASQPVPIEKASLDEDEEIRILMQKIAEQDRKIAEHRQNIAEQELKLKEQGLEF